MSQEKITPYEMVVASKRRDYDIITYHERQLREVAQNCPAGFRKIGTWLSAAIKSGIIDAASVGEGIGSVSRADRTRLRDISVEVGRLRSADLFGPRGISVNG